jgi:hypothetical protein
LTLLESRREAARSQKMLARSVAKRCIILAIVRDAVLGCF